MFELEKDEANEDDKAVDDFPSKFFRYFYQFKTFFKFQSRSELKAEQDRRKEMNDYHPIFITMMLFLLVTSSDASSSPFFR